ncbi:hypothetical protein BT96DRAFT_938755 [Gymnopus androsaceus JB14]|uniref:Uncharacterized protein n=1 Tax=Gymnopus androsaceus JB14 TaxID=1447944 RepID=A0A6A4HMT2_9AGAR|nr:hypothetical protein BT96DRAFT_938755 [Gymnopus androsaceus JB14]
MASNGPIPPPIPEVSADLKFDGGVCTQGLVGYTDGTIPKPPLPISAPPITVTAPDGSTSTTTPLAATAAATAVFSTDPSQEEWVFRNDCAKGIIESHVDNLPLLITDSDSKNAKELFDTLESVYGGKDGMQKVLTMRKLRSCIFTSSNSIDAFFKRLQDLRKESIKAGNEIDDATFREIVLAAFPSAAFDTIIQNIMIFCDPADIVPILENRE